MAAADSGFEQRNQRWAESRGRWDVGSGVKTKTQFGEVGDWVAAVGLLAVMPPCTELLSRAISGPSQEAASEGNVGAPPASE